MSKYPNSGTLSRNDRRETDKQPEFKGNAEVGGVEYWISGWVKESERGKFFSLSFTPKDEAHKSGMKDARKAAEPDDFGDSEIPF
jgi:hypothetical protein